MKKNLMKLAAALTMLSVAMLFTSCGEKLDPSKIIKELKLSLYLAEGSGCVDQADVVKVAYTFPDNQGTLHDYEFLADIVEEETATNTLYPTAFPYTLNITVTQTLRADRPDKASYKLGLHYKLEATAENADGGVLDYKQKDDDSFGTVSKANLAASYPIVQTFEVKVLKNGTITITEKK